MRKKLFIISMTTAGTLICFYIFFIKTPTKISYEENSIENSQEIDWSVLKKMKDQTSKIPSTLEKLNRTYVKIAGFIVPLEDDLDFISNFLFVPTPMACIHVPPPPLNQIIYVKMSAGRKAKMTYNPVWLKGKFKINPQLEKHTNSMYKIHGESVELYSK